MSMPSVKYVLKFLNTKQSEFLAQLGKVEEKEITSSVL